jgi:hypothetical protein
MAKRLAVKYPLGDYMRPKRQKIIGDLKIEEFYWAGSYVTYVNNHLQPDKTFEQVCSEAVDFFGPAVDG